MALRKQIDHFSHGSIEGSMRFDGGVEPGGEHFLIVRKDGERLFTRVWYWDTYNRSHAKRFVQKLASDEQYLRRCRDGETQWAKIQRAYKEYYREIYSVFSPVSSSARGEAYDEASDLASKHCRNLHERFVDFHKKVDDPTRDSLEKLKEEVRKEAISDKEALEQRYAPYSLDHRITFGKHEGKTIRGIAQQHTGYAEWAVEELSNRPKVRKAFEEALEDLEDTAS